ncbi:MAG: IS200/IS605 family transposase [Acidobacteriia bacterium]|nr:IS200/IS605 family transposase [Terriglobia bacterium]
MANTYTQIYIHVVFAVRGRFNLIRREHNDELQKYITGIVSAQKQKLIAINNRPDHMHILLGQKPTIALSDLVGKVKSGSSGFINRCGWVRVRFEWQEGFGAFSHSHSQLGQVIRYIQNQEKHHHRRTFREEYLQLLKKFQVSFDERYLFTPVEMDGSEG